MRIKYRAIKTFLWAFTMIILTGCNNLPAPYVSVPFDIATKGAIATIDFKIEEEKQHPFLLTIYWNKNIRTPGNYTEEEKTKSEAKALNLKVMKLEKNNKWSIILNEPFFNHKKESHGSGEYTYRITKLKLKPGIYKTTVTSLDNIEMHKKRSITAKFAIAKPRTK